jgi:hypothetical protein
MPLLRWKRRASATVALSFLLAGALAASHLAASSAGLDNPDPRVMTDQHDTRIALVAEEPDPENVGRVTGLFSAHWEDERNRTSGEGPHGVPVGAAIAWARDHAPTVLVQLDGGAVYSAGEREPSGESYPPWPADLTVRARPTGTPPDGSEQTVDWKVRSDVDPFTPVDDLPRRLEQELASHASLSAIRARYTSGEKIRVECRVRASGLGSATTLMHFAVVQALRRLDPPVDPSGGPRVETSGNG